MDAPDSKKADGQTDESSAIRNRWTKVVEKALEQERRSWNDFTQGTTLHGLKYVFEPTFRFRRIVWLFAILTAMVLVILQVLSRGNDYFRYETNVDFQVKYRNEVTFPAVTLCNQNNFRLTAIADLNLYNFIDAVYSADNVSDIGFSKYNIDDLKTETFLGQVAHQKKDLIVSCYWRGRPCDIERDFEEQLTGLGVCYTFNAGTNRSVLVADEPGARSGLSLVLNLEQYEYTKGPQSDAGVKILLHGQSEYPLMEDMGFAAAPGTHTLVGVDVAEVKNLPDPYGTCNIKGVPMSDCMLTCRTKQVIDRCGCKAPHMKDLADVPSEDCSIEEYFSCVLSARDTFVSENETNKVCDCSLPCERTQYESSLSYAQLSRFNIERVVLSDPRKQDLVWQKQLLSRETFQQVDKAAVLKDNAEYSDLLTYAHDLVTLAENMSTLFSEEELFRMLTNVSGTLNNDLGTLSDEFNRRWWVLNNLWSATFLNDGPVVKPVNFTTDLLKYISEGNWTDNLVACLDVYNKSGNTSWCDRTVSVSYNTFQTIEQQAISVHAQFKEAHTSYGNTMDEIYKDTPVNPINLTQHQLSLSTYEAAINGLANDVLAETVTTLGKVVNTTNSVDYINEVRAIYELTHSTRFKEAVLDLKEVVKRYSWFGDYSGKWTNEFNWAGNTLQYESNSLNFLTTTIKTRVLPNLSDVNKLLLGSVLTILEKTLQYMDRTVLKLELYHELQYATLRGTADDLDVAITELLEPIKDVLVELDLIETQLLVGFKAMFQLRLPVVSNALFDKFDLLSWARSLEISGMDDLIDDLYNPEDKAETMVAIASKVMDALRKPMESLRERILQTANNLVDIMNQQQSRLHQFAEEVTTSEAFYMSNFMKVDIFYKELKFEKIEQFPAFQALSLLGEIGGFLGLLLGASVLTLIELFDYIVMTIVQKVLKKTAGNKPGQPAHLGGKSQARA